MVHGLAAYGLASPALCRRRRRLRTGPRLSSPPRPDAKRGKLLCLRLPRSSNEGRKGERAGRTGRRWDTRVLGTPPAPQQCGWATTGLATPLEPLSLALLRTDVPDQPLFCSVLSSRLWPSPAPSEATPNIASQRALHHAQAHAHSSPQQHIYPPPMSAQVPQNSPSCSTPTLPEPGARPLYASRAASVCSFRLLLSHLHPRL